MGERDCTEKRLHEDGSESQVKGRALFETAMGFALAPEVAWHTWEVVALAVSGSALL